MASQLPQLEVLEWVQANIHEFVDMALAAPTPEDLAGAVATRLGTDRETAGAAVRAQFRRLCQSEREKISTMAQQLRDQGCTN